MRFWKFAPLGLATLSAPLLAAAPVDYVRDVKPILKQNCYRCHGASQQKSGLRLDTAAALRAGGDSGPSIKTGKVEDNLLLQVVTGTSDDVAQMPYKKPALPASDVATLRAWVEQGALAPADEEPEKY